MPTQTFPRSPLRALPAAPRHPASALVAHAAHASATESHARVIASSSTAEALAAHSPMSQTSAAPRTSTSTSRSRPAATVSSSATKFITLFDDKCDHPTVTTILRFSIFNSFCAYFDDGFMICFVSYARSLGRRAFIAAGIEVRRRGVGRTACMPLNEQTSMHHDGLTVFRTMVPEKTRSCRYDQLHGSCVTFRHCVLVSSVLSSSICSQGVQSLPRTFILRD